MAQRFRMGRSGFGLRRALAWLVSASAWLPTAAMAQTATAPADRADAVSESRPPQDSSAAAPNSAAPTKTPASSPAPSNNELADLSLEELAATQVVVTAARREEPVNKVPYAVSVITAEDIRRAGARSVPDALRLAPGVDVADLAYGAAAVSPRGFHGFLANQTLVLVDGRQIFDSVFGGTLWGAWPFQLEDIERIEVIRGPGGVTWGANAMSGVINIITRDPRNQRGLTLTGAGGSQGFHKEHVGYAFADEPLRMRVSGEYEGSDGFRRGGSFIREMDDYYRGGRAGVYAIYDVNPHEKLTLAAGHAHVGGEFPPPPLAGFGSQRSAGSETSYFTANWSKKIEAGNVFDATFFINDCQASPGVRAIDYRYQQYAGQARQTLTRGAHTFTWGIDTRADAIDTGNSDPHMLYKPFVGTGVVGAYAQDEFRFAPKWTLGLGARLDYEFYGGLQPSGRAALSYELSDDALVYAAVSRAFQMPAAPTRFLDIPLLNGLSHVVGHRDLDAQTLDSVEMGYRDRFFERLDLGANVFFHDYDKLTTLSPRIGPPGLIRYDFDNRGAAQLYGAELEARCRVTDELSLHGTYTFQKLVWDSRVAFTDKEIMTPPEHKAMLGVRYDPSKKLHLSSTLWWTDATLAPNTAFPFAPLHVRPYFRWDLRAEYELWDPRSTLAVGVRNLLDSHHMEGGTLFLNSAEAPRMIYFEFRFGLDPR